MIILDTDVISALMTGRREVLAWAMALGEQPTTTAITKAELLYGIEQLPDGARKNSLRGQLGRAFELVGDVLAFNSDAAAHYSAIHAVRRRIGEPIATMDAMIAAIAHTSGAGLATRNIRDFDGLGLRLIDPDRPAG